MLRRGVHGEALRAGVGEQAPRRGDAVAGGGPELRVERAGHVPDEPVAQRLVETHDRLAGQLVAVAGQHLDRLHGRGQQRDLVEVGVVVGDLLALAVPSRGGAVDQRRDADLGGGVEDARTAGEEGRGFLQRLHEDALNRLGGQLGGGSGVSSHGGVQSQRRASESPAARTTSERAVTRTALSCYHPGGLQGVSGLTR